LRDPAVVLRPFDGGSAAADVWYQLGAKVPPRAATPRADDVRSAVGHVVERRRERLPVEHGRKDVKVFVVALDEIQRSPWREVLTVVDRYITHANPERDIGVPLHDEIDRVELAVDVAEAPICIVKRSECTA